MLWNLFLMNFSVQKYFTYSPVILHTSRQLPQAFSDRLIQYFLFFVSLNLVNNATKPVFNEFFGTEIIHLETYHLHTPRQTSIWTAHTRFFRQLRVIFPIEKYNPMLALQMKLKTSAIVEIWMQSDLTQWNAVTYQLNG